MRSVPPVSMAGRGPRRPRLVRPAQEGRLAERGRPAEPERLAEPGLPEPMVLAGTYTGSSRLMRHATR
jgi:hypothetical protein